jgi:hypothetical protein
MGILTKHTEIFKYCSLQIKIRINLFKLNHKLCNFPGVVLQTVFMYNWAQLSKYQMLKDDLELNLIMCC